METAPSINSEDLPGEDPELDYPEEGDTTEGQEAPPLELATDLSAEAAMRKLAYWRSEAARIRQHADAVIRQAEHWRDTQLYRVQHRTTWYEHGLKAWFLTLGKRGVKLVNGSISVKKGRERVDVTDEDEFFAWAKAFAPDLFRTKNEPKKKEIMDFVKKSGGEVPQGVEIRKGDDEIEIGTNG
jgi:hypothetical protein